MKPLALWSPDEVLKKRCARRRGDYLWCWIMAIQARAAVETSGMGSARDEDAVLRSTRPSGIDDDRLGSEKGPAVSHTGEVEERFVLITDEDVAKALMPHDERPDGFSPLEAEIRAAFDVWLDGLERFSAYVATGLVTVADLRPYLKYWAWHICREHATDGTEDRLQRLCTYMQRYGYSGAYDLMQHISRPNESLQLTRWRRARSASTAPGLPPRS